MSFTLDKNINHKKCGKPLFILSFKDIADKSWELKYYRWCDHCGVIVKFQVSQTEIREVSIWP